jgi:hypothetical protein
MIVTHSTVRRLTRREEEVGHKLYMDNLFSSADTFDELHAKVLTVVGLSDKIIKKC